MEALNFICNSVEYVFHLQTGGGRPLGWGWERLQQNTDKRASPMQDFLIASGNESSAAYQWDAGNAQFGLIVAATPAHQLAANAICGSNPTVNQVSVMVRALTC